ncbi:hypothetical protein N1851_003369 [Merluccius polli]|uniref:Uncharacterized protein n=1 Tax=Merluccius polli TaxID=89951 RepID=A0AA47N8T2_MERPO|nr:hypothetical protein N1851_003369 [Merluccius polli]
MPPFSTDDYYKLLQKIAVLETKILRLEVNMEVNGQYGNETTLPMTQISGKEQANRQMLFAKPKHNSCKDKSLPSDMGRRLTGRTQHLETRDDTEWPALPSHRRVSSTPVPRRKQPWNVAKTKSKSKPTKDTGILLENRFAPLLQDPDTPKERSSSSTGERHLFEADGFCLNKSGVQLLSYNIFDFLRRSPAAPAKDKRGDNPKQQIRQPSGEKLLPPEIRSDQEGQDTEREVLTSSPLPQHGELPPAPTTQHEESPPAPTAQQVESPPDYRILALRRRSSFQVRREREEVEVWSRWGRGRDPLGEVRRILPAPALPSDTQAFSPADRHPQGEPESHSWISVRATQHAARSSLLWAEPSWHSVTDWLPLLPLGTLRPRLVSFLSSLANEMPFLLSSRGIWRGKYEHSYHGDIYLLLEFEDELSCPPPPALGLIDTLVVQQDSLKRLRGQRLLGAGVLGHLLHQDVVGRVGVRQDAQGVLGFGQSLDQEKSAGLIQILPTRPSSVCQLLTNLSTSSSGAKGRCSMHRLASLRSLARGSFSSHRKVLWAVVWELLFSTTAMRRKHSSSKCTVNWKLSPHMGLSVLRWMGLERKWLASTGMPSTSTSTQGLPALLPGHTF